MDEFKETRTSPVAQEQKEKLNINVLLADDDLAIRRMSVLFLKSIGCTVEAVENGKELMNRLNASKPGEFGLVITDKQMPEMDGMEVIKNIRADDRFQKLPIILNSGDVWNKVQTKQAVEAAGGIYLEKPFTMEQFTQAIKEAISKNL